jgi:hypothetical protein
MLVEHEPNEQSGVALLQCLPELEIVTAQHCSLM